VDQLLDNIMPVVIRLVFADTVGAQFVVFIVLLFFLYAFAVAEHQLRIVQRCLVSGGKRMIMLAVPASYLQIIWVDRDKCRSYHIALRDNLKK